MDNFLISFAGLLVAGIILAIFGALIKVTVVKSYGLLLTLLSFVGLLGSVTVKLFSMF